MGLFFYEISDKGITEIGGTTEVSNVCHGWRGITCESEQIKEVRFYMFDYGNFNICSLPSSVMIIEIAHCQQCFELSTRSLPRNLISIYLNSNNIYGSVDLTTLPIRLKDAVFRQNMLTGPITLTCLPRSLRQLDLLQNNIQQSTLWYDQLPKYLNFVYLDTGSKKTIAEIRAVHPSRALTSASSKRIFVNVRGSLIH